jgi:membrane-associated phospholipid phosphatase
MMKFSFAVWLFLSVAASASEAPETPTIPRKAARILVNEVKRYGSDTAAMVRAPLQWDASMWRRAGFFFGADASAFALDQEIAGAAQRNRSSSSEDFSRIVTPFGGRRALNLSAAVLLTGVVTKNTSLRDTGRDALEASILAGGIATPLLKWTAGRSRPNTGEGAYASDPFSGNASFPSGHATNAFAVASVFAAHSDGWLVPTIAYTLATGVAVSRVHDNVHFASDVIAGAVIGTAVGRSIVARHRRSAAPQTTRRLDWSVRPIAGGVMVEASIPIGRR